MSADPEKELEEEWKGECEFRYSLLPSGFKCKPSESAIEDFSALVARVSPCCLSHAFTPEMLFPTACQQSLNTEEATNSHQLIPPVTF